MNTTRTAFDGTAHAIQPFYAGLLARASGLALTIEADGDAIAVVAR
jgi:hypothetical protein